MHDVKKLLQIKGNYYQNHYATHKIGEKSLQGIFFIVLLFICAYNTWVISPPCPHPLSYHPLRPLSLPPTPLIPGRNYFALISNFVEERV
jgi:hypothetical protein